MESFSNKPFFSIGKMTYEEIDNLVKELDGDFDALIKDEPDRVRMLFARLFDVLPSYDAYCTYIIDYIKPSLEFYKYASKEMVFFSPNKIPTFFFNSNNKAYDELKYFTSDVLETSSEVFKNVYDMLDKINPKSNKKELYLLKGEFVKNIYASDMPFLETGNKYFLLTLFDWLDPNLQITEKDKDAFYNLAMLECGLEFTCPFFNMPEEDEEDIGDDEEYPIRPYKEGKIIANNLSKVIGTEEAFLSKVLDAILSIQIPYKRKIAKILIKNYEKASGLKYEVIDIDNAKEEDDLYTQIIDHYMDKFINGTSTDEENELMLMDLMNSDYDEDELQRHLNAIEEIIFTNKNPFLLTLYQSLLVQEYAKRNGLIVEEYYYSPSIVEDGAFCEDYNEIRFYLFDELDLEYPGVVYEAMITAYHEARHAFQFQKHLYSTSTLAFLNSIDREIIDKSFRDENNKEYKERYEDVFYERDARIHAYYESIKRLSKNNRELLREFIYKIKNPNNSIDQDIQLYHLSETDEFLDDCKKQRSTETFMFELKTLYDTFSLPEIAKMRSKYPTFEIAMHEDGTLLTYNELYEKFLSYTKDGKKPSVEELKARGFIYGLLKMYQKVKDNEEFNLFEDSTSRK